MAKPAQCERFPHHACVAHGLDLETRFVRRTMAMRESAAALVECRAGLRENLMAKAKLRPDCRAARFEGADRRFIF
ncbi:MAG TPA: hypothetical protein VMU78_02215 [Methylocella sp.]|nr:hypothetical protein [Methylocella sp.]